MRGKLAGIKRADGESVLGAAMRVSDGGNDCARKTGIQQGAFPEGLEGSEPGAEQIERSCGDVRHAGWRRSCDDAGAAAAMDGRTAFGNSFLAAVLDRPAGINQPRKALNKMAAEAAGTI